MILSGRCPARTGKPTAGAALLTLGVYLAAHAGGFSNFFRINEYVRQQVYWTQRWLDPGLYPDHWLTEYARQYTSWGVRALYPWSVGLWARQKPMLEEFFWVYYAADPEVVEAFCLEYGVDYMLVQERDFTPGFLKRSRAFIPWHQAVDLPLGLNGFFARLGPHWRVEVRAGGKGLPSDHPFFSPFDELIAQAASHGEFALLQDRFAGVQMMEGVKLLDMRAFSTPERRR